MLFYHVNLILTKYFCVLVLKGTKGFFSFVWLVWFYCGICFFWKYFSYKSFLLW